MHEKEILVVSFGTTFPESRAADIGGIEAAVQAAYPEWTVCRAFTSRIVKSRVLENEGIHIDSVPEALEKAVRAGVRQLVIQPTHLMRGIEFEKMQAAAADFAGQIPDIRIAEPLLGDGENAEDFAAAARAVVAAAAADAGFASAEEAALAGTAFVFMGHGTPHSAKQVYTRMQEQMAELGYRNVFIGTVEGEPEQTRVEAVIPAAAAYPEIVLRPLMVVAGDHANNDMAGPDEDSWRSQFLRAGTFRNVTAQTSGMGSIPAIQRIYLAHTAAAMADAAEKV